MATLEEKLAAAQSREEYTGTLKETLDELACALCVLAHDEGLSQPFRIRFKDQSRSRSRIAELWIHGAQVWMKLPDAVHLTLPVSGTLTSANGRTITMDTLE